jgi:hypothetical protein
VSTGGRDYAGTDTGDDAMLKALEKTSRVADVEARLAPRSGEQAAARPRPDVPIATPEHTLPPPTGPPLLAYDTYEAARVSGICRSILYDEIRAGRLIARKRGRRTVILDEDLRSWLAALPRMPARPAPEEAAEAGPEEVAS